MSNTKVKTVTCPECYERFEVTFDRPPLTVGHALAHGVLAGFVDCWRAEVRCPKCHIRWRVERGSMSISNKFQRVT